MGIPTRGPSRPGFESWLVRHAVLDDGRVLSWHNPAHAGFAYPESAALLLNLWAVNGHPAETRRPVADALMADVTPQGGLGRAGRDYAFDAAAALAALDAHARAGGEVNREILDRVTAFVGRSIDERCGVSGAAPEDPDRWSARFGGHLIKACARLARRSGAHAAAVRPRVLELVRTFDGERFRIHRESSRTYLHAHAYALEGLTLLGEHHEIRDAGVAWMARIQTPSGGMPAWYGPKGAEGLLRSDATAQAVRLWLAVDREAFRDPIARGIAFLRELQVPSGGVRYEPESSDVNVWATIFAAQATTWADVGARFQEIV